MTLYIVTVGQLADTYRHYGNIISIMIGFLGKKA